MKLAFANLSSPRFLDTLIRHSFSWNPKQLSVPSPQAQVQTQVKYHARPLPLHLRLRAPPDRAECPYQARVHAILSLGKEETKFIAQLYQDAISEGGKLVLYHGGDTPTQQDGLKAAFAAAFPKINLAVVVDYSKCHNVRVDNQLASDTLVPDVVALQTLQDFLRWADEGKLLSYKPASFSQIYDGFKDPSGAWYAYIVFAFTYLSSL